jgi:hypothetical protein
MKTIFMPVMISGLVLLGSCSTHLKPRDVAQYYVSTGVEKYFLSDLPEWANYSVSSGCYRTSGIRYFNIDALMKSYSLKYSDAIQIQASFNEEYLVLKKQPNVTVGLKEEEVIFFKASDKVSSRINFFEAPTFKQVHLIWLDEALKGKKEEDKLKNFLQSSVHDNGFPVLISACLTKSEIEAKFPNVSVKAISAEMFSIYDRDGVRKPSIHIQLEGLFKPEQKLILYLQESKKSLDNIKGNYKVSNY